MLQWHTLTALYIAHIWQEIINTGVATPVLVPFCVEMHSPQTRSWPRSDIVVS